MPAGSVHPARHAAPSAPSSRISPCAARRGASRLPQPGHVVARGGTPGRATPPASPKVPDAALFASFATDVQQLVFDVARIILARPRRRLVCLVWVLVELGVLRTNSAYDSAAATSTRSRSARFAPQGVCRDGKPRTAYRHLQENTYSLIVIRFLFDLIRNYQTERLAAKPLKLLQEYEYYTLKRLERTRILIRIGPMLGLAVASSRWPQRWWARPRQRALSDNLVTALLRHRHRPADRRPRLPRRHRARSAVRAGHLRPRVPTRTARGLRRAAALRPASLEDRRVGRRGSGGVRGRRGGRGAHRDRHPSRDAG